MTHAHDTTQPNPADRQGRQRLERAGANQEAAIRQRIEYFQGLGRSPEEIARFVGVPLEEVTVQLADIAPPAADR